MLVVVDGVFSMEGDVAAAARDRRRSCARHGARLMVDEAHGVGVLGARGAGAAELLGVEDRVDLRMGTFSKSLASCGGFIAGPADVIEYLRISSRAVHVHRLGRAGGRRRRAGRGAHLPLRRGPAAASPRVLDNARYWRAGLRELGFRSCRTLPTVGVTPIVPVLVGDDWKAALLWRALYDAGVYVNVALHPAVPPGGALLRTSVMATHDRATLDRALEAFADVKRAFEAEHGPLPGPARSPPASRPSSPVPALGPRSRVHNLFAL